MPLPCYPAIEPIATGIRTIRRVVHHKFHASAGVKAHAAHHASVGHGMAAHAPTAATMHAPVAAGGMPAASGTAQPVMIAAQCSATPGALPVGPGGAATAKFGGAMSKVLANGTAGYPAINGTGFGASAMGGGAGFGGAAGSAGSASGALASMHGAAKAALVAGGLAAAGMAGYGGVSYLKDTGAFNSLIDAPVASGSVTASSVMASSQPTSYSVPEFGSVRSGTTGFAAPVARFAAAPAVSGSKAVGTGVAPSQDLFATIDSSGPASGTTYTDVLSGSDTGTGITTGFGFGALSDLGASTGGGPGAGSATGADVSGANAGGAGDIPQTSVSPHVPEPSSIIVLLTAMAGTIFVRRRAAR